MTPGTAPATLPCCPQIMWEAARLPGGKQEWADVALAHSRTVARELFRCVGGCRQLGWWPAPSGAQGSCCSCCSCTPALPARLLIRQRQLTPATLPPCRLCRPDGSTFHVVQFDPDTGAVVLKRTHQGYRDGSTWSRGQAWAIVGFTHAYAMTRDPALLATARTASDVFLKRLAEAEDGDGVPLW